MALPGEGAVAPLATRSYVSDYAASTFGTALAIYSQWLSDVLFLSLQSAPLSPTAAATLSAMRSIVSSGLFFFVYICINVCEMNQSKRPPQ